MKLKFKYIFIFLIFIFLILNNIYPFRDPFSFPISNEQKIVSKKVVVNQTIKVVAILSSNNKKGAILKKDDQTEVVFVGDIVWGYNVQNIDKSAITLLNLDQKIVKLFYENKD